MRHPQQPSLYEAQLYGILDLAYVGESEALDVARNILSGECSSCSCAPKIEPLIHFLLSLANFLRFVARMVSLLS